MRWKDRYAGLAMIASVAAAAATTTPATAQDAPRRKPATARDAPRVRHAAVEPPDTASEQSEQQLIAALEEMRDDPDAQYMPADLVTGGSAFKEKIITTVDALLRRFPKSSFRDEALILKMRTLAYLARVSKRNIGRLLLTTREVRGGQPTGALAVSAAYYSIQAFVLAARAEGMPDERQWLGAVERYRAFIHDFPDTQYTPILWASLIRDAIKLGRIDEAREQLKQLQAKYPDHPATRRAYGEVVRQNAVGSPFVINLRTNDGKPAGTSDYYGKVLIVHFWASWNQESVEAIPSLIKFYEKHEKDGLAVLGISADKRPDAFLSVLRAFDMPWRHVFDGKGMANDVIVMLGVTHLPDYYIVDRRGYLRAINPKEGVEAFVEKLLKEPVKPIEFKTAGPDDDGEPTQPPDAGPTPKPDG